MKKTTFCPKCKIKMDGKMQYCPICGPDIDVAGIKKESGPPLRNDSETAEQNDEADRENRSNYD